MAYIFGGNTGVQSPEELSRKRDILAAMAARQGAPRNVGEGLTAVGQALAYRLAQGKAAKADAAGRAGANELFSSLFPGQGSGAQPSISGSVPASAAAEATKDPVTRRIDQGFAPFAGSGGANPELRAGIEETADSLGIDPVDLATAISYETAGTFDPTKKGPTTKWGQHRGLIQFGEPQAKQHGVDWNDPVNSQLGENGAVASYLKTAGVKPGMGLLDVYSAINAGAPGLYNRSDAAAGGAPGTVRDKVEGQMAGHREKALALFGGDGVPPSAGVATGPEDAKARLTAALLARQSPEAGQQAITQAMAQQAPVRGVPTGSEPVPVQQMVPQQAPAPAPAAPPQQVAQVAPAQRGATGPDPRLIEALGNKYLTPGQRAVVEARLKQQMQASDPLRQIQLERERLELEQLRNPPAPTAVTALQERARLAGLQPGTQQYTDFMISGGKKDGVTVNVGGGPELGKLSTDYGYVLGPDGKPVIDPETGLPKAAAVPGSPAAQDAAKAVEQAATKKATVSRSGNVVLEDIDRALTGLDEGVFPTTGLAGGVLANIPGTQAFDVGQLIETVRANTGFDRLQQMRDSSPTGGALGAVSEKENALLQAALGNLSQSQSGEQLRYNLERVRKIYDEIVNGPPEMRQAPAEPDGDVDALIEQYGGM